MYEIDVYTYRFKFENQILTSLLNMYVLCTTTPTRHEAIEYDDRKYLIYAYFFFINEIVK